MVWAKVSDNKWERPLDGLEGYFSVMANVTSSLCDGREHYTIFSKVKLEFDTPDVQAALKHAWKQLRYEQPNLAATVSGFTKTYVVPDEQGLAEWLDATFIVSDASDAEELYQSAPPIKQATLYYVPKASELAFRAHHYTVDGNGVLLFWDAFFTALANPMEDIKFGDETERLAPIMEELLGFSETPTPEQTEKATSLFMSWAGSIPGIGPVSQVGVAPSGKCQNVEYVFPTKTTEEIVKASKAKGISVTAAVQAAYIAAIEKHADKNGKLSEYVTANQFNLRRYLPEPYNSSKYAISVFYTPIPYKVNLPASYDDVAQSLQKYYQTTFKEDSSALELKGHFTRVLAGAVQTPEFLANPVPRDALVSSLGVVEQYVQQEYGRGIKVSDLKMGVDVVLGMSMFFIYSFRDQLRLVYSFNDGFEKPEHIQTYLEETQAILVKELLS